MPSLKRTRNRITLDLTRGAKLLLIALAPAALMFAAVYFSDPRASADVIATEAAVPLVIAYLMIRIIMWLASGLPEPTEAQKLQMESERAEAANTDRNSVSWAMAVLAVVFVVGVWCVVNGFCAALVYRALGLRIAFGEALSVVRWVLIGVGTTAVALCLIQLCKLWLLKIARLSHELFENPFSVFHGRA
jgi:hypothetical protein